jgi:hypothetical protein
MTVAAGTMLRIKQNCRTRGRRQSMDEQMVTVKSEFIERSKAACDELAQAIRDAHENLAPADAVKAITSIWESLDKTAQLAEARMRLCLPKLPTPELADRPDWIERQLPALKVGDEDLAASHPLAVEAADLLIRACLQASGASIEADIEKGPLGNVIVDWNVEPHALQWEVEAARLPWPGVKVNALVMDNSAAKPQGHTRIFHTAFEVIDHFKEQLDELGFETTMP